MKRLIYSLSLLLFASQLATSQQISLKEKLPMDPAVKVGKLSNGLTYYIRKNVEPKNRAQLRLVLKAGSILEDENQRGLAHFMEHMDFNGTKNFPKNEMVNFLEKNGIQFGADLNAYTSFDETVYMLPVPTDTLEKLDKFMMVLSEWAAHATLEDTEIDKERGVVLEESRLRKGAQSRIQEKLLPVIFNGSRYAQRLPIGLDSIIQNAPYSSVRNFHHDWYRPNLQAVVAVGDFDPAQMEAMIKKYFGGIENPKNEKVRIKYEVPLKGTTEAIVITDKEQPYNMVQLYYLQPEKKEITAQNRRESIMASLFNSMISQRLQELMQKADPPYQFGMSNYSSFLGNLDALTVMAVAKGADVEKALKTVLDENERVSKFGFTETELERAKLAYKSRVEKQFNEKDKTDSESFVEELVQCFLNDVVMTDISFDNAFVKEYLEGIKLTEVNALVKKLITKDNRVLALIGSEKDKDKLPTEAQLKEWIDNTGSNITAYVDEAVATSLVSKMPKAGKIVSENKVEAVGVTELVFDNGMKVNLKPTDFKNDEIKFRGNSWGGSSLYDDKDFMNASFGSYMASVSGNGNLKASQLTKFMSGKVAQVNAVIGSNSEAIIGSSSVKDFETALQMVYNRFTNNNLDPEAAAGAIGNQRDFLINMEKSPTPEKVFGDSVQSVMSNYAFRGQPMTSARMEGVNPEKAMEVFKERFNNASDFEFTFVGNFDIEKIKPLLLTYLGGIPGTNKKETFRDLNINPPTGKVTKIVKKGTEDKARVLLSFTGTYAPNDAEELQIKALGDILSIKLTEKLREEESGVYSPYANGSTSRVPMPRYTFRIGYGCSPANVDKLVDITMKEIEKIKANGAETVDIEKFVSKQKLDFQTNLKNNDYWLNALTSKYQNGDKITEILTEDKLLDKVSVESTKATAKKYLSGDNIIKMILLPEDK
ncbi:insulinase family protein [Lacihabitans sp. LS3-19]|uniref:M16 family metallopeptidase n=1 Tax=Lacihabitans sp. LS3-19 TaxID=2487335 RepID=UPI0020CBE1D4|nr:insulinase family protein [Lacihabitans sp. LS3-19]MCP9770046.1 insulinase family protein [Lacihabitans sp. LS3-19]